MATNHASIKLSRDLVDEARREGQALHRSAGAQVEHWARIGQLLENTPGIGVSHVRAVLTGTVKLEDLPTEQRKAFYASVSEFFRNPDQATVDFYAAIGAQEGAVGTDGKGGIVRTPPGRRKVA